MFTVPGWSLPSSGPATQTDSSAPKKKTKRGKTKRDYATGANADVRSTGTDTTASAVEARREKKLQEEIAAQEKEERKGRGKGNGGDTTTAVTAENVDKLWRCVIAGEVPGGKKRKRGSSGGKKTRGDKREEDGEGEEPLKKKAASEQQQTGVKKTLKEKRREKKAAASSSTTTTTTTTDSSAPSNTTVLIPDASKLTPLQQKMRAKLTSARFRHINETLYTTPSQNSLQLFTTQPEMYSEYHLGFRQQVLAWPENPVDTFISLLRSRSKIKFQKGYTKALNSTSILPLPKDRETGVCTVADLGCGDAKIAATFNHGKGKKEGIKVLSFDLQASTPDVTIADIANLPLEKESIDVVIFCLALMGTNFLDFVDEAHRILRWRGELWVAEIKSRFHRKAEGNSNAVGRVHDAEGGDEPEMEGGEKRGVPKAYMNFVEALKKRGFMLKGSVDERNRMFVRMEFVKQPEVEEGREGEEGEMMKGRAAMGRPGMAKKKAGKFIEDELKEEQIMKPCVYKLR